jgi:phosphoesterase RecJ-like protein
MESYTQALVQAKQFIEDHDDFLVISHLHPDGDATGSSLAMAHLLTNLGKSFVVANEGVTPNRFSFLTGYDQIINFSEKDPNRTFSTVIALDIADYKRIGGASSLIEEKGHILNIDHHPTNTRFGEINVIRSTAASTTEILYDLITGFFPSQLDFKVAESLYTGVLTDTGGFRYSNTTQPVLEMAASLLQYGVKPSVIAEHTLETISRTYLSLLGVVLQSLEFICDHKVAFLSVTLDDMDKVQASKDDVDGLVSYPRNIEGVEVGILFKQVAENEIKVSLRAKHIVDVAEIAQRHDGGGHAKASGFTYFGSLEEAKALITLELQKILGE